LAFYYFTLPATYNFLNKFCMSENETSCLDYRPNADAEVR